MLRAVFYTVGLSAILWMLFSVTRTLDQIAALEDQSLIQTITISQSVDGINRQMQGGILTKKYMDSIDLPVKNKL